MNNLLAKFSRRCEYVTMYTVGGGETLPLTVCCCFVHPNLISFEVR